MKNIYLLFSHQKETLSDERTKMSVFFSNCNAFENGCIYIACASSLTRDWLLTHMQQ